MTTSDANDVLGITPTTASALSGVNIQHEIDQVLTTDSTKTTTVSKEVVDSICSIHSLLASLKERQKAPTKDMKDFRAVLLAELGIADNTPLDKTLVLEGSLGNSIVLTPPVESRVMTTDSKRKAFHMLAMIDPNLPFELMSFTLAKLDSNLDADVMEDITTKITSGIAVMSPHVDSDDSKP